VFSWLFPTRGSGYAPRVGPRLFRAQGLPLVRPEVRQLFPVLAKTRLGYHAYVELDTESLLDLVLLLLASHEPE
jgi:hypothetical protein